MKRDDAPELVVQISKNRKIIAKGVESVEAVKWPLRFAICAFGCLLLTLASTWYFFGIPAALLGLAKLF